MSRAERSVCTRGESDGGAKGALIYVRQCLFRGMVLTSGNGRQGRGARGMLHSMQKLVAGAFSAEHEVSTALQELLSMEDISHGCLEIFAPHIQGLIGISDNREIVAAQISPDGPIGIKALKLLLHVRSGRYAFREGHRIQSEENFTVNSEDLNR